MKTYRNKKVLLSKLKNDGFQLEFASNKLKNDREVVILAVKQEVKFNDLFGKISPLRYASRVLRNDREVVLEAVKQNGKALQYANEELRNDKEFVLEAVKQDGEALQYANEELRNDKEVVLEAVEQDGYALQYTNEELRNDKEVVLEAVKQEGYALQYANEELRNDKEVVLEAVKQDGEALQYANEELRNDKEVVLEAVKQSGEALEYASEELRNDKEVVLEAVKQSGEALQYANEELRNDKEFVLEAVEQNGEALEYASEELRNDKEVVLEAVKQNGYALGVSPKKFRRMKEVVIVAVRNNLKSLKYASKKLQNDPDILCMIELIEERKKLEEVKNETRVLRLLEDVRKEEISKMNPSKDYRDEFLLDFDQKMDGHPFFDRGCDEMKTYQPFPMIQNNIPDRFFETVFVDRRKDEVLDVFLRKEVEDEKLQERAKQLLNEIKRRNVEHIFPFFEELIKKVSDFFGGFPKNPSEQKNLEERMKAKIGEIKRKTKKNIVKLGELESHGVCRHRSLLFKLVCDMLHLRCRLVRGHMLVNVMDINNRIRLSAEPHCWNVVHLKNGFFVVDCMNYKKVRKDFGQYRERSTKKQLAQISEREKRLVKFFLKNFGVNGGKNQEIVDTGGGSNVWKKVIPGPPQKEQEESEGEEEEEDDEEMKELFPDGSTVAVKVTFVKNIELRFLQRAASIIKSFDHPNIIRYVCSYCYPNHKKPSHFCLVQEYIPRNGKDFIDVLELESDPSTQAIESLVFLLQTARGLRYLHESGFLHLDLKPNNILVEWNEKDFFIEKVKLIDFVGSKDKSVGLSSMTFFQLNTKYAAPEVTEFIRNLDSRSHFHKKKKEGELSDFLLQDNIDLPFDESADIFSFGKVMEHFLKFLDFSKDIVELAEKCTRTSVNERPRMLEIVNKLMRLLEFLDHYKKRV